MEALAKHENFRADVIELLGTVKLMGKLQLSHAQTARELAHYPIRIGNNDDWGAQYHHGRGD